MFIPKVLEKKMSNMDFNGNPQKHAISTFF